MCITSFSKVTQMRSLDNKWLEQEARSITQHSSIHREEPTEVEYETFIDEKRSSSHMDLEAQTYNVHVDHLFEIAESIVALKHRKFRICADAVMGSSPVVMLIFFWFLIHASTMADLAHYFKWLEAFVSLVHLMGFGLNLQYYRTTVAVKNLRDGVNLNKHDICKLGTIPRLIVGAVCFSVLFSILHALSCLDDYELCIPKNFSMAETSP
ncbi:hypothetical protein KGF57_003251 [Candida theae]|uniref:Uncharacterized protein n=1 Tax=Candida theae TaxID=1198502 RepID=A0AAD5BDK7_9ASCO|nr:uncharacterized protein KGF57_003251 [Candida theae]KAI5957557.1 hypothetical protein KGF57_003251 [Candida theae]